MTPGLRFIVVEDHPFQLFALEQMLRDLGAAQVVAARDGVEALRALEASGASIDIAVTDLDMPNMDGMELIRHLGAARPGIALVILSAQDASVLGSVEAMASAYGIRLLGSIRKPVSRGKLQEVMARLSALEPPRPPDARTDHVDAGLLDEAIRGGQLQPYFQPKCDIRTQKILGVEALARWVRPYGDLVMPGMFIPVAEQVGLMPSLTATMLQQSVARCARWQAAGLRAPVCVNVPLSVLSDVSAPDGLTSIVFDGGLQPGDVVLEITEATAASDEGALMESLSRLRMRGFGLAIDDYGTGYASLKRLTKIPLTELKVDQSFVREALVKSACRAVLESSLELAAKLGVPAVAEGVETFDQRELLIRLGYGIGQGFHFCEPLPGDEFMRYATRQAMPRG